MANNNRTVTLTLDAQTQGQDSVKALAAELRKLAQSGGDAAPEFERLSTAIESAINSEEAQAKATQDASVSLKNAQAGLLEAKAAVSAYTAEIGGAKNANAEQRAELERLTQAVRDQKANQDSARATLAAIAAQYEKTQAATRGLVTEADRLRNSLNSQAQAATSAGSRIEQALGVVGLKSAAAVKAEILKVDQALVALSREAGITGEQFDQAFKAGKARIAELEKQLKQTEATSTGLSSAFKQWGPASLVFNGVSAAIGSITSAAARIPQVTAEFQTLTRTLTALTGSSTQAAKEIDYLKAVSNRVGADIKELGSAYARLTAATKDTTLAGAETRRIFEAVAGAMGTLGASTADTEGALLAISQMVSKGVVSMEEFRQQLGERLPGAFQVTAKELGITTADLNDLITSGKLAADDVLPALAAGLEKVYQTNQQNDTLAGQWNAFTNALKSSAAAIGESGLLDALFKVGRVGVGGVTALAEGFMFVGKAAVSAGDALLSWDSSKLTYAAEEAEKLKQRLRDVYGITQPAAKSLNELAQEAEAAGRKFVDLADGTRVATRDILHANDGFVAFLVNSAKAQTQAETFATQARKVAEATKASGEASLTAAGYLGDEIDKRNTAAKVANDNAAALWALVKAEQAVLSTMEAEALKRAEAIRDGQATSDQHKKALVDLGLEIEKRRTVVDGLVQQADAHRLLSEALKIEAETSRDNSDRLDTLRANHEEFTRALELVRKEVDAGRISQQQAAVIEEEARKNKRLYIDALDDQIAKTRALNAQKQAEFDVTKAGIQFAIEQQRTAMEVARARGDEYSATQALLNIKRLEIQLAELTAKAKKAEAEAALENARAAREELKAKDPLNTAKEAEIKASEAGARVKLKEAEIAQETARRMRELSDATNGVAAASSGASAGILDVGSAAQRAAGQVAGLNSELDRYEQNKYGKPTNDGGFLNGGHQASRQVDVLGELYRAGASVEEAKAAEKYYGELYQRLAAVKLTGNLGNSTNAAYQTNLVIKEALQQSLGYARQELTSGKAVDLGTSVNDLIHQNLSTINRQNTLTPGGGQQAQVDAINAAGRQASTQNGSPLTTVNIHINGQRNQLTMQQKDVNTLTGILKQLESDAMRST